MENDRVSGVGLPDRTRDEICVWVVVAVQWAWAWHIPSGKWVLKLQQRHSSSHVPMYHHDGPGPGHHCLVATAETKQHSGQCGNCGDQLHYWASPPAPPPPPHTRPSRHSEKIPISFLIVNILSECEIFGWVLHQKLSVSETIFKIYQTLSDDWRVKCENLTNMSGLIQ